ncbi:serine hydrolase [Bacillus sp. JJ1773]|uniref:serine hydrolase n=1 Tax=Bacillus sp. JJ1773 TaxID=3122965 RepID=UPI0030003927
MELKDLKAKLIDIINNCFGEVSIALSSDEGDILINEHVRMKAASVIKLPILIESFRLYEQGKLDLERIVEINNLQKVAGTGVIHYLTESNSYSFRNLLELMMIVSDNTASNIALNTVGMDGINSLSEQLNCINTKVERNFMDADAVARGLENSTTAYDMLQYLKIVGESNEIVHDDSRLEMMSILAKQQFTQKLPGYNYLNSGIHFYNKTGELPGFEHDISMIKKDEDVIFIAVLSQGWSDNFSGKMCLAEIGKEMIHYLNSKVKIA